MDAKYFMIFIVVIFGHIIVYVLGRSLAESKHVYTVTLYTDLVDIIGKNASCAGQKIENETGKGNLYSKQGIVISSYQFRDADVLNSVIGKCDVVNVRSQMFSKYTWNCFATENKTSRDTNWFFVDCLDSRILTIRCLEHREVLTIIDNLCTRNDQTENSQCHDFLYGKDEKYAMCSRNFRLRKTVHDTTEIPTSYTTVGDLIAYLCVAFILVTFLLAVLIPAEKCKPTYKFDKEQEHRIPLEIYEMYGVNYRPAAKKKRVRRSVNIDCIPTIESHTRNVAVVANTPVDWKGHKTKFKFHPKEPLFNPIINGSQENNKARDEEDLSCNKNHYMNGRRKNSAESTGTVGTFDYTLFQNQIDENDEDLTSERKKAVLSENRRNSLICKEKRLEYRKRHIGFSSNCTESVLKEEVVDRVNDDYVFKWLENNGSVSDKRSSACYTNYEVTDERRLHSMSERRHSQLSNPKKSISNNIESEDNNVFDEYEEDSIKSDSSEKNRNRIIENENVDFASADVEAYDRIHNNLITNHIDRMIDESCKCKLFRRDSISNDATSGTEKADVKLGAISECPSSVPSGVNEICPQCSSKHKSVETNELQSNSRPRIPITVELRNNVSVENVQPVVTNVKQENRSRISKRSSSTDNTNVNDKFVKPQRKYSLC